MDKNIVDEIFKLKYNNIKPKQGYVILSEPFAEDIIFKRSVVLLAEYNKEQTVGFILNKKTNINLADYYVEFKNTKFSVYIGGPVNKNNIYYIHTLGNLIPDSIEIKKGLYWSGNFDIIKLMIVEKVILPSQIMFFIGYSGWDYRQFNDELKHNFWLVSDISNKLVMKQSPKIWQKLVSKIEPRYKMWRNFPENPNLN